jgi:MFS family permease
VSERASIGRVLIARNFWPYFAGNLLSNSGTWFQSIAQVLLIYRLTGSPFLVGVVNFSQFAAVLFLAPWAGVAADRFDRRRLVVTAQLGATALAALLAVLTWAGLAAAWIVVVLALGLGVATAVTTPALQAIVPSLVRSPQLPAAMALNAVTFNLSRALGPVLAVAVIARFGIPTAFAVNALSYLALIVGLTAVSPRTERIFPDETPRLRDSLRMVRRQRSLLGPLVVVGIVSLSADPVNTLTPSFSTELFGQPDTFTGLLVGSFGAGAVLAAFTLVGRRPPSYPLMVLTLGLLAAGMTVFALANGEVIAVAGLALGGFGYLASVTVATSLLHLALEEAHRGRIMSLWSLSFHGSRPIGSLIDGSIASLIGLRAAALSMVLPALSGCVALALVLWRRRR